MSIKLTDFYILIFITLISLPWSSFSLLFHPSLITPSSQPRLFEFPLPLLPSSSCYHSITVSSVHSVSINLVNTLTPADPSSHLIQLTLTQTQLAVLARLPSHFCCPSTLVLQIFPNQPLPVDTCDSEVFFFVCGKEVVEVLVDFYIFDVKATIQHWDQELMKCYRDQLHKLNKQFKQLQV